MKRTFFALVFLVVAATLLSAQVPRTISYQGVLTDGGGNPISDGAHSLTVRIYDAPSGGALIHTETQTVVTARGIFSAIIGATAPIPASLAFDRAYWLGLSVDGGVELAPLTALTSVPYALRSAVADALAPGATGVVTSINGQSGALTLQGAGGTTISQAGGVVTITSTGGGGSSGIAGLQSPDGSLAIGAPTGPVASITIADGGVTAPKLAAGSVTNAAIADNAVLGAKIADNGVSETKIADNAVRTSKIMDGTVTLPKLSTTGATSGQVIKYNGSTAAWAADDGMALPFSGTLGGSTALFRLVNTGTADAMQVLVNNPTHGNGAISATSNGVGFALGAANTGTGAAAIFRIQNANSSANTITGSHGGTGRVAWFQITNAASGADVIKAETSGSGVVLRAESSGGNEVISSTNSGTGGAGNFVVSNVSSAASALAAQTNGTGSVAYFNATASGSPNSALTVRSNSSAIFGRADGTGGSAAVLRIYNNANTADAVVMSTAGTGDVLTANHTGSSGSIAVFQSAGANVARIDKTGKGYFNGGTQSSGADIAEAFDVEGPMAGYEPGDVLVISTRSDRTVALSNAPSSTLVVGVYATKPGVLLTERTTEQGTDGLVPMGVVGVIPTKVCAENGPIARGDLLVTSSMPGRAMKAGDDPKVGTVIGKALENFDGDTGIIKVLVNVK